MTVWKARFLNFPLDFPLHMKKKSIIVSQTDTLRGKVFPLHRKEYPMMHFSDCTLSSKGFFSIYTVKNFFNYFQDWHPKEQGRPLVASPTSSIFPLYMLKNYIFFPLSYISLFTVPFTSKFFVFSLFFHPSWSADVATLIASNWMTLRTK